jgi:ABC-2 type transport system ATP-binding protein
MNILCGVLSQTEGQVLIRGVDMREEPERAKSCIGFLPQNPPLYYDFTVDEYLTHCAHLRLMPKKEIPAAHRAVKERCGIVSVGRRLIRNLSGGYRQRVGIAQAIIHRPHLVILDEPTNGLDPNQIVEMRSLIKEISEDRSVLFSSHILPEIQATCRDVMMIENGRIVFSGTVTSFNEYLASNRLLISMGAPPPFEALRAIPGIKGVERVDDSTVRLTFDGSPDITERLIELSVASGWRLREINIEKNSLESVFAHLSNRTHESQP